MQDMEVERVCIGYLIVASVHLGIWACVYQDLVRSCKWRGTLMMGCD